MYHQEFLYQESELKKVVDDYSEVFVLVDENTKEHCAPILQNILPRPIQYILVGQGEAHKTIQTCEYVWQQLMSFQASRKCLMINLGGGMLSDLGGFCASVFKRGVDYINIPTTLLAMVDAAFGGKTAVNFMQTKNIIGSFYPAQNVYYHTDFLKTLPRRQLYNGFAEMLKHGLIAYADYFEQLCQSNPEDIHSMLPLIKTSIDIKQQIVDEDPHESGLRKILNAGHTIGHALETAVEDIYHGEAVAWGLLAEARLSNELGILPFEHLEIIEQCIHKYYITSKPEHLDYAILLEKIQHDKKNKSKYVNFSLLQQIGTCGYDIEVELDEDLLRKILY